jgi:hypothetical protein
MDKISNEKRVARFNEIEDEIEQLRLNANAQAGDFLDAYDGKKGNFNLMLGIGAIIVVILSAINIAAGVLSAICYAGLIYAQHTSAGTYKSNMENTLARIDKLRAEQKDLEM